MIITATVTSLNIYTLVARSRGTDHQQEVSIEAKIRVFDSETKTMIYEKAFPGYGCDEDRRPYAMPAAIANLLDHALSDPGLVESLTK